MSHIRMCVVALVFASAPLRCGAHAALAAARSVNLPDHPKDVGLPDHTQNLYAESLGRAAVRHDFVPIYVESNELFGVDFLVAFAWAGFVAATPILVRYLDRRPITTGMIQATGALCLATLVGMYFCTSVILFQSTHFDGVRSLTIIESVYFLSQVIATVGYGDITPAGPNGQLLVGLCVLCALGLIAVLFAELVEHVRGAVRRFEEQNAAREETRPASGDELEQVLAAINSAKRRKAPALRPLASSLLFFGLFACSWVIFFRFWPGEDKPWVDAVFMSAVTLSTVGFGTVTPSTEAGMIFAAFWMLFGGAALAGVIVDCVSFMACLTKVVQQDSRPCQEALHRFSAGLDGDHVTEADFIRWGLMQQGLVTEDDLDDIKQGYSRIAKHKEVASQC